MNTLTKINLKFKNQKNHYAGKVRDIYLLEDDLLIVIVSDRISAFDVILPKGIPYKGQILNQISTKNLKNTSDIVKNWLIDRPDPNVSIGIFCEPFKVEMVIRGYLTGHAAREYKKGKRVLSGVFLPNNMKENQAFLEPIITPTIKAEKGNHDEDISKEEIIKNGIVSKEDYEKLESYTYKLFQRGTELAKQKGLILADTKYEFGKSKNGEILLIDEIHTPDSSRFFYIGAYEKTQKKSLPQKQLSKEFVRQWLINNNFQGIGGQKIPEISDDICNEISNRYIELYEIFTGETFQPITTNNIEVRIKKNIDAYLKKRK